MIRPLLLAIGRILLVAFLAAGHPPSGGGALAQAVGKITGVAAEQRAIIDGLAKQVDELEKRIAANPEDDARLLEIRLHLEELGRAILHSGVAFRPRLAELNGSIERLGPPPAEGQPPEPDIVTGERAALAAEKAEINAALGVAELLSIRINGLIDRIATIRSDLFLNMLTKRYALTDVFTGALGADISKETSSFYRAVSSWMRFVYQFKAQAALAAAFFATIAALILLVGGRRLLFRYFEADPAAENPSYLSRLSVAFWSTLLPTLTVGVFLGSTLFFFNYFNVLRGDIGVFLNALFTTIALVFCVQRLAYSVLSPSLPNWRLIAVESRPARRLARLITAMAVVIGVNNFLSVVNQTMGSPLSLTIARSFLAAVVVGVLLILIGLLRDDSGAWRPWRAWLRYISIAMGCSIIAAALLGYIGLANFVSLQVVVTGTILATAYIGFLSSRAIGAEGGFAETALGRRFASGFSAEPTAIDQMGLLVSLGINLMIVLIFLPLILFMWGFQPGDIQAWGYRLATGFTIGAFSFSPLGVITGVFVFVIGILATRWFQGWLDGSVMERGRLDTGVRNSIRTVVGYAGMALAGVVALSAAGINLSNLALIAGGLSLGIGFGLQNVVSNFVSGLILLAERPFKAGDWIVAGSVSGTVKKISVRATEIETFQRQSVILPNSELINSAVGNWTHRNRLGRVDIRINVAYGSDVKRVHALLLDIARNHPLVLKNPEPFVLFANFGTAALEFEIRVMLADIFNGNVVQNDIRFSVLEIFDREGIEIPSTPRAAVEKPEQKWTGDDDRAEAEMVDEQLKAQAARPARGKRAPRKPDPD